MESLMKVNPVEQTDNVSGLRFREKYSSLFKP